MTFPTTPVLDTFTGTNGDDLPVYSGNWDAVANVTDLEIQSNAATGISGTSINQWNPSTFGPDCEVYATITTKQADTLVVDLGLRIKEGSDVLTSDGYLNVFVVVTGAGNDALSIYRLDDGGATQLGTAIVQEMTNGDSFGMEMVGSTLTGYYKSGAGAWAATESRTDSTYAAAGNLYLVTDSTGVRIDDFGGGTAAAGHGALLSNRRNRLVMTA